MARNNMEIILGALADTVRTQDIEHLTGLLDQDVVWEGVHSGQRCDGRDQAMGVLGGFFTNRELVFDAVEVIARGDAVVVGIHGPGLNGIPGDFETVGQVFHVFTLRDGLIVRWKAYLDREDALAAASSGGPVPAPTA
jgi:ketosteroid isomerase-like protein